MLTALGTMVLNSSAMAFCTPPTLPDAVQRPVKQVGEASIELSKLTASHLPLTGTTGKLVTDTIATDRRLQKLSVHWVGVSNQRVNRLGVGQQDGDHSSSLECPEPRRVVRFGAQIVRSTAHADTEQANVPDANCSQVGGAFSGGVDFPRDWQLVARFGLAYEASELDEDILFAGHSLGSGSQNGKDMRSAMRLELEGRPGDFVSLDRSRPSRAFLASPLTYPKVTSSYGPRVHPVSGVRKNHMGTDYGALAGTPVRTVADGVVTFAGRQGGYGNYVAIRHPDATATSYAHLERITVSVGQRVHQGQNVGTVGSTGTTTGPNLHFEYLVRGVRTDPANILGSSEPSTSSLASLPSVKRRADAVGGQLSVAASIALSSMERADRATATP